jgi:hypothetical protein
MSNKHISNSQSGNWLDVNTWDTETIPTSVDMVTIGSGNNSTDVFLMELGLLGQ